MAATGAQFRDAACTMVGWRYEVDGTRLIGSNHTTDCSGLVYLAAKRCGFTTPTVSWLDAQWCRDSHTLMNASQPDATSAIQKALSIPGCLLLHGADFAYEGYLSGGHVAITMGDGRNIVEAKGHKWGVLIDSGIPQLNSHWWDNAAYVPGLIYSGNTPVNHPVSIPQGNPMYSSNQFVSIYSDGEGHTWGLHADGGVYTLAGSAFYGAYPSLLDAQGHHLQARTDFGHITARPNGKEGYTLWPLGFTNPMQHYDFGPDLHNRLGAGLNDLEELIKATDASK